MVQVVFIHGVSVRREPNPQRFDNNVTARWDAFKRYCFKAAPYTPWDPYWGGKGASPDLGGKYLVTPAGSTLAIGSSGMAGGVRASGASEPSGNERRLLDAARQDFGALLNTLSITLAADGDPSAQDLAEVIADYVVRQENDRGIIAAPDWLNDPAVTSDLAFVERLELETKPASATVELGIGSALKKAAGKVLGAGLNLVDGPIEELVRGVTPKLAQFLGDAFVYLKDGRQRDAIRDIITNDLVEAGRRAGKDDEKLIVVGHSMGAIIFYDMITDPDWLSVIDDELGFAFGPDLFLSVGTQLGLFEELNLFTQSVNGEAAPFPSRLGHWWHVLNRMDVLSFAAEGIFEGVQQFSIDTEANIVDAHGAYFRSPVFYRRLRKRLLNSHII